MRGSVETTEFDITTETISLTDTQHGLVAPTYLARPLTDAPSGAVIVYHSSAGWIPPVKEIARRFAVSGYICLVPNLHYVDAPDEGAVEAAKRVKELGGVSDEMMLATFAAASSHLRSTKSWNGKMGCIGFCAGGRQTFLTAATYALDAAVVCYGGNIVDTGAQSPDRLSRQPSPPIALASSISCEMLGLFGDEDTNPSPNHVQQIATELKQFGIPFDFQIYPHTGHAFFDVSRDEYRPASVSDGWSRISALFERKLRG